MIAAVAPHLPEREPAQGTAPQAGPGTATAAGPGVTVVEGRGRLLLPAFSDVHVHLDSNRLGLPFRGHTGGAGVWTMMLNDRNNWRRAETPITERAATALGMMVARGTTRVRTFAQVDADCRLERFDAVAAARPAAAVMDRLPDRTVIHRGRMVADGLRLLAGPHGE
ncbi:hypothetical protein ACFVWT_11960 [Arthrobacter sp. NPDC058288]|uniref:hypothetical protein n=1 Tax=Arthrobacter sp. NPDC058288 TaxID=3346424 RepID=UPI0036E59532